MENETTQAPVTTETAPTAPVTPVEVAAKPDEASQESFSKRFSALNRERKALSQKEIEIKKEAARIEAEKAEIAKWKSDQEEIKKSLNPLKALELHGYKYQDAAEFVLNDDKPTPDLQIKSVRDEVQQLKQLLEQKEQAELKAQQELLSTKQQAENQKAIDTIKTHLSSNPDFDALVALNMQGKIFDKINTHYEETGEVLKIDDIASELMQEVEELLGVVTNTSIYKKKFATRAEAAKTAAPKTLSSSLNAQTVPSEKKPYKSDAERMKNAIALLSK